MARRMTRLLALACAVGLVTTLTACAADREGPPGTFTLVVGDSFPTTHPFSRDGAQFFVERATELSGGQLQFDYHPSENLGAAEDFVNLARSGVVDIAMVSPGYVSSQLPLSGVADLPAMTTDPCQGALGLEPLLAEGGVLYENDFAPDGLHPLVVGVVTGYEVMTGGGVAVTDPSDVDGMVLRSSGGAIDRTVDHLGAAPVAMPVTEMYEAISRGTVDGTVLGPLSALPYRLDEAATHSTLGAQLGSFTITYSIGRATWDGLPPDLQDVLTRAGLDTNRHLCREVADYDAQSRDELEAGGLEFHRLTPDEQRRWREVAAPVREEWVADMERMGLPGRAVLDDLLASQRTLAGQPR